MSKSIMENYLNNFYLDYLFEVTDCRDYALIFLIDSVTIHLTTDKFNSNTKKMRKFYQKIFKSKMRKTEKCEKNLKLKG